MIVKDQLIEGLIEWTILNKLEISSIESETIRIVNKNYPELNDNYDDEFYKRVKTLMTHWISNNNGFRMNQQINSLRNNRVDFLELKNWIEKYIY